MTTQTIFQTPGNFDMEAVRTSGMSVKPNSANPIGRFGTGLKYAIAVLLRNNAKIDIYTPDNTQYSFYTRSVVFRGETFSKVRYKKMGSWFPTKYQDLDYTTQLGRDWKIWQAFREFYANTLDEGGIVYTSPTFFKLSTVERGYTYFVIQHDEFSRWVDRRHEIFLPQERQLIVDEPKGNISKGGSSHIYYRGMRAADLPEEKPALFTYNIIAEQELTEDRTLKSSYSSKSAIKDLIVESQNKEMLKAILTAPEKSFEHDLDFSYAFNASPEFNEVVKELANNNSKTLVHSARSYYSTYLAPPSSSLANECSDEVWNRIIECLDDAQTEIRETNPLVDPEDMHNIYLNIFRKGFNR